MQPSLPYLVYTLFMFIVRVHLTATARIKLRLSLSLAKFEGNTHGYNYIHYNIRSEMTPNPTLQEALGASLLRTQHMQCTNFYKGQTGGCLQTVLGYAHRSRKNSNSVNPLLQSANVSLLHDSLWLFAILCFHATRFLDNLCLPQHVHRSLKPNCCQNIHDQSCFGLQ